MTDQFYFCFSLQQTGAHYLHEAPARFLKGGGKSVTPQETLYGLMQGGHNWWYNLDLAYNKLGYLASRADSHVQYKCCNNKHTIMNNYNNDMLGASMTQAGALQAKAELGAKFEVKDNGETQVHSRHAFQSRPNYWGHSFVSIILLGTNT